MFVYNVGAFSFSTSTFCYVSPWDMEYVRGYLFHHDTSLCKDAAPFCI